MASVQTRQRPNAFVHLYQVRLMVEASGLPAEQAMLRWSDVSEVSRLLAVSADEAKAACNLAVRIPADAVASLQAGVGPADASTATALYNLGGLAKRQAKWDTAERAYGEALAIFKAKLGMGAQETADCLYQMGCLHKKRNSVAAAAELYAQAADAYAACYGEADRRVGEARKRARDMAEKTARAGRRQTTARR
jgi:tetratricopeptide (TPR) repeat protein